MLKGWVTEALLCNQLLALASQIISRLIWRVQYVKSWCGHKKWKKIQCFMYQKCVWKLSSETDKGANKTFMPWSPWNTCQLLLTKLLTMRLLRCDILECHHELIDLGHHYLIGPSSTQLSSTNAMPVEHGLHPGMYMCRGGEWESNGESPQGMGTFELNFELHGCITTGKNEI